MRVTIKKTFEKLSQHESILIPWNSFYKKVSELWMSSSKSDIKLSSFSYLFPAEMKNTFVLNEFGPNDEGLLLFGSISLLETNFTFHQYL